jgi:hypothetical protein
MTTDEHRSTLRSLELIDPEFAERMRQTAEEDIMGRLITDHFAYGNDWEPPVKPINYEHVPQLDFSKAKAGHFFVEMEEASATDDVAVVQLAVTLNGQSWVVLGSSKRAPEDKPDRELGVALAMSRALEKVARQVGRQANGRLKHNDSQALVKTKPPLKLKKKFLKKGKKHAKR